MKTLGLMLAFLASFTALQTLSADEITGVLGTFRDETGGSYFGVAVEQPLVMKTPGGEVLKPKFPQLAGLDSEEYAEAVNWNGRRVRITGQPMERHTHHHATPVLWIADKVILEDKNETRGADKGLMTERINLFGVSTDLVIQEKIPEYAKSWSQVRGLTLARLNVQPQDKPSLREARKRIHAMQIALVRKLDKAVEVFAETTGKNPEDVSTLFQAGEGAKVSPKLQEDTDVLNGLYQIESALVLKLEKR